VSQRISVVRDARLRQEKRTLRSQEERSFGKICAVTSGNLNPMLIPLHKEELEH